MKIFKISFLPIFKNAEYFTQNPVLAFLVILVEIIGVVGIIYLLNSKQRLIIGNVALKYFLNVLLIIVLLTLLLSLILSYIISKMTLF